MKSACAALLTVHCLLLPLPCTGEERAAVEDAPAAPGTEERFEIRNLEGFTLYMNRAVLAQHPEASQSTLEHLRWELYQVRLAAPAAAVTHMQEHTPIWIEYEERVDLSYHPDRRWLIDRGYTIPKDPRSMVSLSVKTHLGDSYRHPFVLFHELAHGHDFHFVGRGRRYGNDECQANYERMMEEKSYEDVLRWSGQRGSHYARSNRMEYWAESTEAYFAVNDFYPFVRAELREHDPRMAGLIERYWGVDPDAVSALEAELVAYKETEGRGRRDADAEPVLAAATPAAAAPASAYERRDIKGWTVHVNPRLADLPGRGEAMITLLTYKLHMVRHFLGEEARAALQAVPIWLEPGGAGPYLEYCDSRERLVGGAGNPEKHRAVEIRDPARMRRWALLQQSDLLHALALGYLDRCAAADGDALREQVEAAFRAAGEGGKYDAVLRFDGNRVRHPGLASAEEYFSELVESYFLVNDHYPFLRCQLADQDPTGYALVAGLWEGNPRR